MRRLSVLIVIVAALAAAVGFRLYRSDPDSLGSTQPLALGTGVSLQPNLDHPAAAFTVAAGQSLNGKITFQTYKPPGINRPTNGGKVALFVTATLDVSASLPVDGQTAQEVVVEVEPRNRRELGFVLPALDPGHHCLVVASLESPAEFFRGRDSIDHYTATAIDISAGAGPEHCRAARVGDGRVVAELPVGCHTPLITPDPSRARHGGRFDAEASMWAMVPACPEVTSLTFMLHHDNRPVLTDGTDGPTSYPADGQKRVTELGRLPRGTWRTVIVASDGTHSLAYAGPPVVID